MGRHHCVSLCVCAHADMCVMVQKERLLMRHSFASLQTCVHCLYMCVFATVALSVDSLSENLSNCG